jgi:hypothetical protein
MFPRLNIYIVIIGIALLVVLVLTNLLVISLLLAVAFVLSFLIQKSGLRIIGIELVTFVSVIAGYVYGPFIGIILSLVLITFHLLVSGYFGIYFAWVIPEYPVAAYFASSMTAQSIAYVGVFIIVALNIANIIFTAIAYRQNLAKHLPFAAGNILFNIALFMFAGQFVVDAIK